ncbi:MAG: hypothetical protein FWD24_05845 [Treponema sp.]|nr:hypothetical protein [Treponema sp.]
MKKTFMVGLILCLLVPALFAQTFKADLGRYTLRVLDNFQWGSDYQGNFQYRNLLAGNQIQVGETYTLGTTDVANLLVFSTEGEGTARRAGGGIRGAFQIDFTEFVLTK